MFLLLISCNSCGRNKIEEPEGIEFVDGISFEKDSNIYPINIVASSQRIPAESFGFHRMFDGDSSTAWETIPGTSLHEFIYLKFDSLRCNSLKVDICNDIRHVSVFEAKVWINDVYKGTFPSQFSISGLEVVNSLQIEFSQTEGLNLSHLSYADDSTKNRITEVYKAGNLYSSKPAGIAEISFYDNNNSKLPVKAFPTKKVKISSEISALNNEFDDLHQILWNGQNFAFNAGEDAANKKILFSFPDDQVMNKIKIGIRNSGSDHKIGFNLRFRKPKEYLLNPQNEINTVDLAYPIKGRNFELTLLSDSKSVTEISDFSVFDGSRWLRLVSDSVEFKSGKLKDSLKTNFISKLLNSYLEFNEQYSLYYMPLKELRRTSGSKVVRDTLPYFTSLKEIRISLKSDQSCIITQIQKFIDTRNSAQNSQNVLRFFGKFRFISIQNESVQIELCGFITKQNDENQMYGSFSGEKQFLRMNISPNQIQFQSVFDSFRYME